MSSEALSWALEQPLGGAKKIVLLGIANHADRFGRNAWPSVDTLAMYAHVDPRSVTRAIAALEREGYLEREIGQGGTRAMKDHFRPNLYHLKMERKEVVGGDTQVTPGGDTSVGGGGDTSVTRGVTPMSPPGGDTSVTQTTNEPHLRIPPQPPTGGAPGFDEVFAEYPRQTERDRALQEWQQLQPSAELAGQMVQAIRAWRLDPSWQREGGRFVPRLWRWLRDKRWEDVPGIAPAPSVAAAPRAPDTPAAPPPPEVREKIGKLLAEAGRRKPAEVA